MKLHQLRDMIAVADLGSIRAGARHLNISQSAITKSIQQLERELDVPLFERQKRGVVLTPMGALFVQRARAASAELLRAQEEINQHRGVETGRVTISLSTVPHMALLPSVIEPFIRRYPNVKLTIQEALGFSSVDAQLRSGAVDAYIGVASSTKVPSDYQVETLFANQRIVVARAGHPLAQATSLKELVDARWLVSNVAAAAGDFTTTFRKHRIKLPERITYASTILSQLVMLLNSDMLLIAPKQVIEFPAYQGLLVPVPVREAIDAPSVDMIRRASSPLTPAAEHFCDLLRRAAVALQHTAAPTRARPALKRANATSPAAPRP